MSLWSWLLEKPPKEVVARNNQMVDEVEASGTYLGRTAKLPRDWDGRRRWWHCQRCGAAVVGGNRELHDRWHDA